MLKKSWKYIKDNVAAIITVAREVLMKKVATKERKNTKVNYFVILIKTIVTVINSFPRLCRNAWNKNNTKRMNNSKYMELTPSKEA